MVVEEAAEVVAGGGSGGGGGSSGGGSGGSSGGNASGGLSCNPGWVPHSSGQYCVKAQSYLDMEQLYEEGRALALAGDYDDALALLGAADQGDAMVLTMIGYSKRKSGALHEGIGYYYRALAIDPDNVNTREYLGEGYVAMGRLDLAQGRTRPDRRDLRGELRPVSRSRGRHGRRRGLDRHCDQLTRTRRGRRTGGQRPVFPAKLALATQIPDASVG